MILLHKEHFVNCVLFIDTWTTKYAIVLMIQYGEKITSFLWHSCARNADVVQNLITLANLSGCLLVRDLFIKRAASQGWLELIPDVFG